MPAWTVHLCIASEVANKLNIKNKNSFIYGNILPDVCNGFIVKNVTNVIEKDQTHFYDRNKVKGKKLISNYHVTKFFNEYKKYMDNDVVLGYISHLFIDGFWNKYVYNVKYHFEDGYVVNNIDSSKVILQKNFKYIKQSDFNVFGDYLIESKEVFYPSFDESLVKDANIIKENPIDRIDIINSIDFINNVIKHQKEDSTYNYEILTKDEMKDLYNESVKALIEFINCCLGVENE